MKWNEVPKFKEFGIVNPTNIGFVAYVGYIENEIEKYNLQLNPEFQRGHIWTESQQIAYIEFLLRGGKSGRDFYFNWNKITNDYVCVDGLQRTISLQRFVRGEIKVFNQYFDEFGFTSRETGSLPLPEYRLNIYTNNLSSEKDILEWYVDMNAGGTPHTSEEIERVKQMIQKLED